MYILSRDKIIKKEEFKESELAEMLKEAKTFFL